MTLSSSTGEMVVFDSHGVFEIRDAELLRVSAAGGVLFKPSPDGDGNNVCGIDGNCADIACPDIDTVCNLNVGICLDLLCF